MNDNEAVLWDLYRDGVGVSKIAEALSERFGIDLEKARDHVQRAYDGWKATGLTKASESELDASPALKMLPAFGPASLSTPRPGALRLRIADRYVGVSISDPELRALVSSMLPDTSTEEPTPIPVLAWDDMRVTGTQGYWTLCVNGTAHVEGEGKDALVAALHSSLSELGCDTGQRLFVMHGAGLVSPGGTCLLMSAQGGSGKTTLAMGLEAEGFRLLSDDVVPISTSGAALSLGLPACVKAGSWDVLNKCRPDLLSLPRLIRFGEDVRYLPPRERPFTGTITPNLLLFPKYLPNAVPSISKIAPEDALRKLIEADSVIRDLTQKKLNNLCAWINALPAYELVYPSLAAGIDLVRRALDALSLAQEHHATF